MVGALLNVTLVSALVYIYVMYSYGSCLMPSLDTCTLNLNVRAVSAKVKKFDCCDIEASSTSTSETDVKYKMWKRVWCKMRRNVTGSIQMRWLMIEYTSEILEVKVMIRSRCSDTVEYTASRDPVCKND